MLLFQAGMMSGGLNNGLPPTISQRSQQQETVNNISSPIATVTPFRGKEEPSVPPTPSPEVEHLPSSLPPFNRELGDDSFSR